MSSKENSCSLPSPPVGSSQSPLLVNPAQVVASQGNSSSTPTSNDPSCDIVNNEESGKRKLTSDVWNHYKKMKVDGKDKAQCNYCKKHILGGSKYGTSHLREHLKRCSGLKFKNIRDMRQKFLVNVQNKGDGKEGLSSYHFDQDATRKELANMFILHEFPLSIVDYIGFRRYSYSLQPLFKMVSRNTIKRDIFKIYDYEKSKVSALLDKIQNRVAITIDMWTSSNIKRGFMVVTAHFIDDSWILQNWILRFIYVPSPHTKEVLSDVLLDCLLEWNIDRKLSTLTVDNCSTNDAMIRILLEKLQSSSLILSGSLIYMRCAAHILNLIVQDGLRIIEECIEKIRDSVVFWTGSTKRRQKFEEIMKQLRISSSKELVLDCKTRWNSTYLMLSTALLYKDVFFRLKQRDSSYACMPSEEEWKVAKDICEKLELFYNVTEIFSGTTYPIVNTYFTKVCEVKIALTRWLIPPKELIRNMASSMLDKFNSYWNVIHGVMGVAAILDPRLKMKLLEWMFTQIYGNRALDEIARIKNICYELLNEYNSKAPNAWSSGTSSTMAEATQSMENDFFSGFDLFVSSKNRVENVKVELDHYIEDGVLPRTVDFDILAWWKNQGIKYPTLRLIAKDILAIPVSTVASESAFSTSGRLLSPHRSRLQSKMLEVLMCAQNWLWTELKGSSVPSQDSTIQTILDDYDDDEEENLVDSEKD